MKAKHLIAILAIVATTALASCQQKADENETVESNGDAALELYYKYANDPNLTVAYLGDFTLNGNKIDALMIQADNDNDWKQLKLDFGMSPKYDSICFDSADSSLMIQPDDKKVVSVGVGIDTDFIEELGLDSITDLSQVPEDKYNQMIEIIAGKVRDIVNSFSIPDTVLPSDAVIVGQGPLQMVDDSNITMDEYINTLAQAVGNSILNEVISMNNGTSTPKDSELSGLVSTADSTMTSARNSGHCGYITAADYKNRTLWLFFYDNQEECNNILTHIKDDILVAPSPEDN
ncbi:MAG: hypothetical protein IJ622_05095 [Bacteroidales bacterium]|nr:hypothetical protein [Bacteroidales bacterium]